MGGRAHPSGEPGPPPPTPISDRCAGVPDETRDGYGSTAPIRKRMAAAVGPYRDGYLTVRSEVHAGHASEFGPMTGIVAAADTAKLPETPSAPPVPDVVIPVYDVEAALEALETCLRACGAVEPPAPRIERRRAVESGAGATARRIPPPVLSARFRASCAGRCGRSPGRAGIPRYPRGRSSGRVRVRRRRNRADSFRCVGRR